jgi:hypothetical protein
MAKEVTRSNRVTYVCTGCGAANCRLWREYQTMACYTRLLCCDCAEKDQQKKCHMPDSRDPTKKALVYDAELKCERHTSDQIGWFIPAVPTDDWDTFWGYTSVPYAGVTWWYNLPLRPKSKR